MKELRRVSLGILAAFLVVSLGSAYWGVLRRDSLLQRVDNPRLVEAERALERGHIYDQRGVLLAETSLNYNGTGLRRLYPHTETAPVTGYYSLRYGVSGAEAAYDDVLRGEVGPSPIEYAWNDLLHQPRTGGDIRLSIDLEVQKAAAAGMAGNKGAAIVITVPDGAVRAMVSIPTFNPNTLDEDWGALVESPDGVLLNRATQGVYQPGGILQTALLATALTERIGVEQVVAGATLPVSVNDLELACIEEPPTQRLSLIGAYQFGCPAAFAQLRQRLELDTIDSALWRFGLLTRPDLLGLNTDIADSPLPLTARSGPQDITASLTGQNALIVTPLQVLDLFAAIANGGNLPLYRVVDAVRVPGTDTWEPIPLVGLSRALLTQNNAAKMQEYMALAAESGVAQYAQTISDFPIVGHAATAYSGADNLPLQWFAGMIAFEDGSAVVTVVVIEESNSIEDAVAVGAAALDTAARLYRPIKNAPSDDPLINQGIE